MMGGGLGGLGAGPGGKTTVKASFVPPHTDLTVDPVSKWLFARRGSAEHLIATTKAPRLHTATARIPHCR